METREFVHIVLMEFYISDAYYRYCLSGLVRFNVILMSLNVRASCDTLCSQCTHSGLFQKLKHVIYDDNLWYLLLSVFLINMHTSWNRCISGSIHSVFVRYYV